jgi:hypothetical protein
VTFEVQAERQRESPTKHPFKLVAERMEKIIDQPERDQASGGSFPAAWMKDGGYRE